MRFVRALAVAAAGALVATPACAAPTPSPTVIPSPKPATPKKTVKRVTVDISPGDGKFGVGQLITAKFSAPVVFKAAAEQAMVVTGSKPLPPGAWGWIDSQTAVYRPKDFWPGKTRITVSLNLRKVPLNSDASTKWVGGKTTTRMVNFRTSRSFIARIDANTHQMLVYRNDVLVKVFGVSLGKPGFRTRSGIKIITGEKYLVKRMTSDDLGLTDETYDLQVPYAVRITPSGEYIHGAPWAAARIGVYNGSHGCTNLNLGPSKWFYNHVQAGDPTVNRHGPQDGDLERHPGRLLELQLEGMEGEVGPGLISARARHPSAVVRGSRRHHSVKSPCTTAKTNDSSYSICPAGSSSQASHPQVGNHLREVSLKRKRPPFGRRQIHERQ